MKLEPLVLPRNCGNCRNFDGEWCALPWREVLIQGPTRSPALIVCAKHEPKDADDVEGAAV